jgi:hypothetical protein
LPGQRTQPNAIQPPPKEDSDTEGTFSYTAPHTNGQVLTDDDKYHVAKFVEAFRILEKKTLPNLSDKYQRIASQFRRHPGVSARMAAAMRMLYNENGKTFPRSVEQMSQQISRKNYCKYVHMWLPW